MQMTAWSVLSGLPLMPMSAQRTADAVCRALRGYGDDFSASTVGTLVGRPYRSNAIERGGLTISASWLPISVRKRHRSRACCLGGHQLQAVAVVLQHVVKEVTVQHIVAGEAVPRDQQSPQGGLVRRLHRAT